MEQVYLICAVIGGTILVVQTVLLAFGLGHHDVDASAGVDDVHGGMDHIHPGDPGADAHHEGMYLKVLSLKALVAMLTFFGLAGMASLHAGLDSIPTLGIAMASGAAALLIVGWLMAMLSRLQSQGNVNLNNAVGVTGKVYLRIPARRAAPGKVTVGIQGRTVECKAVTAGPEIPTGTEVRVVGLSSHDTLDVTRQENV